MIRGAIDSCVDSHGSCPGREPMSRPLRLLNVMSGDRVRLEAERPRSRNPPVVYAALSYCWGASQAMKEARTTAGNLNERMAREGFSPASLPKTLRDAIAVTRLLGMQYLWIDALCIVQDCKAEWTSEAQRMMEYYGHARVTIVPVEAESADSGMRTGIMRPVSCRLSGLWSSDCGSDLVLCSKPPGNRKSSVSHSPWNRRGWTYQESLNSSRILFIFGQNATLECREGIWDTLVGWSPHKRQDWSRFLPFSKLTCPSLDRLDRDWAWLVQCYTERRLSNPRDKWFAFCGIADAFSRASGREIVAGLWRDRILEDIVSWRCRWKAPRKRARKSIPDLPRQDSLHNNPLTSPTPPPSCSHCGASEYASDPTNPANQAINLPSWTWLAAPWSDHAPGIPLSKTAITRFDPAKPHATILSVILPDNTVPTSPKLSLSTPAILPHASLLRVLSHARDNAPPATAEGPAPKDSGIAFLDDSFAEAMDLSYCSSCERGKHGARDCASYRILLEIQPPVEAILVGTAGFLQLGANGVGYRHFVLVQAVRGGGGGGHGGIEGAECREYRRVGTMHCVEGGRLGEVVEQELGGVEERRVVLV
ncbi:heterokaryon incompatibility protein-domain-containing protein [Podospora aff. communis PSN243]|uniref:Heterokaryon incompatibility protein-domain-containing protein n=1 Tax=Podospora aff. communis PSN243 TaxID=3040156 RepID=A0AAV9G9H6_9PEZI|nr:heterokaryon incompatibility protein-domain-containing protein [Podospora aff. communis PSN243]